MAYTAGCRLNFGSVPEVHSLFLYSKNKTSRAEPADTFGTNICQSDMRQLHL